MRETIGESRSRIANQEAKSANTRERTSEMPEELAIKRLRAESQAESQHAMADYRRERTKYVPLDYQLRMMNAKANLAFRMATQAHQAVLEKLSEKRMELAKQRLGLSTQEANNRYVSAFGGVPTIIEGGGQDGAGPLASQAAADTIAQNNAQGTDIPPVLSAVVNGASQGLTGLNKPAGSTAKSDTRSASTPYLFNNAGLTAKQQLDLIQHQTPYQRKTSLTNELGWYQKPENSTQSQLDQVQVAMPQLSSALNVLATGAKYYMSAPDQGKRYLSAVSSFLTGKPTADAQNIIQQAGISKIAMIEAVETLSRVQQLAKTNETFAQTMKLVFPDKSDTIKTYAGKQQSLFDEMKKRYLEAQYTSTMGKPNSIEAARDMNAYVNQGMLNDYFESIYEPTSGPGMPELSPPIPNQVGFYGNASMNQSPVGRENVTQAPTQKEDELIKALMAKGYSKEKATELVAAYKTTTGKGT